MKFHDRWHTKKLREIIFQSYIQTVNQTVKVKIIKLLSLFRIIMKSLKFAS